MGLDYRSINIAEYGWLIALMQLPSEKEALVPGVASFVLSSVFRMKQILEMLLGA
jgi:hypothetical protein